MPDARKRRSPASELALQPPALHLGAPLGPEDEPREDARVLEIALRYGQTTLDVRHFDRPAEVTVGEGARCDIRVALEDDERLVVARQVGPTLYVRSDDGVEEPLDDDGVHALRLGELTLSFRYVAPARVVPAKLLDRVDLYLGKTLGLSLLGHALLLFIFHLTPQNLDDLSEELIESRFADIQMNLKKPPPKKKPIRFSARQQKKASAPKQKPGQIGRPDKPKRDTKISRKGAPKVDPDKRRRDIAAAENSGLLKMLRKGRSSTASVFSAGGLGEGVNVALGGVNGDVVGDAGGLGGLTTRGTGPGGEGRAQQIGGLSGYDDAPPGISIGDKRGPKPEVDVNEKRIILNGGLPKDVIGKIIRRAWSRTKFCYERGLKRDPNLYGKVTVFFVIEGNGRVQQSRVKSSTLRDGQVESCVARVMTRLRFPPVPGGGSVDVTYPFVFTAR